MRILIDTEPGDPGKDNEDFAAACPGAVVLLDGASAPAGLESGCVHSVAWYTRSLGSLLLAGLADTNQSLTDVLAAGIGHVNALHAGTCDLDHPGTPSATVVAARANGDRLDYLVLSDSTLAIERDDQTPLIITDNRLAPISARLKTAKAHVEDGPDTDAATAFLHHVQQLAAHRNQPGGFWVAGAEPAAARQAITGTHPLADISAVALLSDGASRIIDRFHLLDWGDALTILRKDGPHALIARTRQAEHTDLGRTRWPRSKTTDDATAIYWPLQGSRD